MTQKCLGMHRGKSGDAHEEEAMQLEEIHCMEAISSPEGHSVLWCDRRCRKHWIAVARALVSSPWDSSEHGAQREDQAGFHPQGIIHCSQGWHRQCCHSQLARLRGVTPFFYPRHPEPALCCSCDVSFFSSVSAPTLSVTCQYESVNYKNYIFN